MSQGEISVIDSKKNQFVQQLTQLQQFDIGQENSEQVHNSLEQQFINFYNDTSRELRTQLVYLRQEAARKSKGGEDLAEQQREKKWGQLYFFSGKKDKKIIEG